MENGKSGVPYEDLALIAPCELSPYWAHLTKRTFNHKYAWTLVEGAESPLNLVFVTLVIV
jgi:hypothetical protein